MNYCYDFIDKQNEEVNRLELIQWKIHAHLHDVVCTFPRQNQKLIFTQRQQQKEEYKKNRVSLKQLTHYCLTLHRCVLLVNELYCSC